MVTKEDCRYVKLCRGKELSRNVECFMCHDYMYDAKNKKNVFVKSILDKVQSMQGYEPECNSTMTTQHDGKWVEKDYVLSILKNCLE